MVKPVDHFNQQRDGKSLRSTAGRKRKDLLDRGLGTDVFHEKREDWRSHGDEDQKEVDDEGDGAKPKTRVRNCTRALRGRIRARGIIFRRNRVAAGRTFFSVLVELGATLSAVQIASGRPVRISAGPGTQRSYRGVLA